ncbi:hypothetical protein HK405_015392, partial [Cladochytrium tenue]
ITPYKLPTTSLPDKPTAGETFGFAALMLNMMGMVTRGRQYAWMGLGAAILALVQGKTTDPEGSQGGLGTVWFSLTAVLMLFVQLYFEKSRQLSVAAAEAAGML